MTRCLLIDSGIHKMMWGAAILHESRIKKKIAQQSWCELLNLSFQLLNYLLLVTLSSWGKGTGASENLNLRHWNKIWGLHWRRHWIPGVRTQHTQVCGSSKCPYQGVRSALNPWQRRDAQTKLWGVSVTGDLAHRWWSSRRSKEKQGRATATKEKWHVAKSVNPQERRLRREASNVEDALLDEKSAATRGSLRDSE